MVSKEVSTAFEERLRKAIITIKSSNIDYINIGIFGSYSRGDYKATSDIDIVVIVNKLPDRNIRATLRDDLDEIGCDVTYMLKSTFENPWNEFSKVVVRDFKEIKHE